MLVLMILPFQATTSWFRAAASSPILQLFLPVGFDLSSSRHRCGRLRQDEIASYHRSHIQSRVTLQGESTITAGGQSVKKTLVTSITESDYLRDHNAGVQGVFLAKCPGVRSCCLLPR